MKLGNDVKTTLVVDQFLPEDNHHPLLGFYVHQSRRKYFTILFSVAALSALLSFTLTWAVVSSRPVKVTFALPNQTDGVVTTPTPAANANSSGQSALSEDQLKTEVRKVGGSIFWAGAMSGAKYTFNHLAAGQDYIRYLPDGQGLSDTTQNYRVIATYKEATAYATIAAAAKSKAGGVSLTNPDGSVVYYAKATPTHVYLAFKNFPYQIEIFDPTPGASLKLATTPGAIAKLL